MYNNTNYFSVVIVVLMLAGGLLLTESARNRCRERAYAVISVLLHAADRASELKKSVGIDLRTLSAVQEERRKLLEENNTLSEDRKIFDKLALENNELRKKLGFREAPGFKLVSCHLIGSDPSPWWNSLMINLGSEADSVISNIAKNRSYAVVSPSGVVGKTGVVSPNMIEVIALVNENCRITATLDKSKQQGILVGEGSVREGAPCSRLKFIPKGADIEIGELVYTSGLDGVFAPGLLLGTVTEIGAADSSALYRDVIVTPAVQVAHLENMFLIVGGP